MPARDDRNYEILDARITAMIKQREAEGKKSKVDVASGDGGPHDPGMAALLKRMDRMEAVLERLEPKIAEIHASLNATIPHLSTKAEMAAIQLEISHSEKRLSDQLGRDVVAMSEKLNSRPTTASILAIIGLFAALAAVPWKDVLQYFGVGLVK